MKSSFRKRGKNTSPVRAHGITDLLFRLPIYLKFETSMKNDEIVISPKKRTPRQGRPFSKKCFETADDVTDPLATYFSIW
jgi:hypothetical protein